MESEKQADVNGFDQQVSENAQGRKIAFLLVQTYFYQVTTVAEGEGAEMKAVMESSNWVKLKQLQQRE